MDFYQNLKSAVLAALTVTSGALPGLAGDAASGGFELQVGGMVAVAPKYEGAKDYRVVGIPFVAPSGSGIGDGVVQFRGPEDLRFRLIRHGGFEAGPVVGWRFSRDEDDADILAGLGDVDGGFVAGGYAAYKVGIFTPFVSYGHALSGDETGGLLRFGTEARSVIAGVEMTATAGASYADDEYMDRYFSVSAAQAGASVAGLAQYDADAGVKDVYFGLSGDVPLAERWSLKLMGRYSHLLNDAADSPVVESESQWFGGAGVTYKFSVGR